MGFRRTLFPEALVGEITENKKGQFTEQSVKDDNLWGSKKISKEDSNGSSKKTRW